MEASAGLRRDPAWRRWRDDALVALGLAALAATLALQPWAWRLDMLVYDLSMSHFSRPAPPGIVIIAIDEAAVRSIGRWPWPRAVHVTLLAKLAALPKPPRAIGLDLLLSEDNPDPALDAQLAQVIRQGAPLVLPVHWQNLSDGSSRAVDPTDVLRNNVRLGAAVISSDEDGVLRRYFLRAGRDGTLQDRLPSFALALLEAGGESPHPRAQAIADEDAADPAPRRAGEAPTLGNFAIRYIGPRGSFEQVSYLDVLMDRVPPERLAGKTVLIGMTANGLGDTAATPVNGHTITMPGIEVHANALYTLRSGDGISRVRLPTVALCSALAVLLLVAAFAPLGARLALPLAMTSVPLAVLASMLAHNGGTWFSPVPYAMAALLAYPLWTWRRLERAVSRLDQEIAHLVQAEPLNAPTPSDIAPRARSTDGDALESRLHALRRAGLMVRETRRFFAEAVAAMPTAMLVGDRALRVVLANPRAAALFEVDGVDELLGLDLARLLGEFTPTAGPVDWAQALAALQPGATPLAVEVAREEIAGSVGSVAAEQHTQGAYVVNVAVVELQGLQRLVVTVSDVATVKQAQRDREEVLAFVSHDLRSPASAIVLLADLHLQGRVQTPLPKLLEEVKRLAGRTLVLSEGLVRAAQVQTQPLKREAVAVAELLDESLADLRTRALAADLELAVELENPALVVDVDRQLLSRAIGNLVGNALRHGPSGTLVLVTAKLREGRLLLGVRDHGRGLNPQQLEQLARGDEGAAVGDATGVGLGLLFVQRVARRHGGALHAGAPAQGRGAYFEIDLPI